jgi:hypothetical protein
MPSDFCLIVPLVVVQGAWCCGDGKQAHSGVLKPCKCLVFEEPQLTLICFLGLEKNDAQCLIFTKSTSRLLSCCWQRQAYP